MRHSDKIIFKTVYTRFQQPCTSNASGNDIMSPN